MSTTTPKPNITLYFLQASRAIRVAWILHELNLPYTLHFSDRIAEKAPPDYKNATGNPLGKSPFLRDGDVALGESGAICQYLCEKYESSSEGEKLMGGGSKGSERERAKVLEFVHAAEGTVAIHALSILYARWNVAPDAFAAAEKGLSVNVQRDLDWLDAELAKSTSGWLVGDHLTLADITMQFSVEFVFARRLGVKGMEEGRWKSVRRWLEKCAGTESYRQAVEKTGYTLFPETGVNWKQFLA